MSPQNSVVHAGAGADGDDDRLHVIDKQVEQGSHFVECMLLGEEGKAVEPFKILGIFST